MEKSLNPLHSTPVSILIGALIIGFTILWANGVVTINKPEAGKSLLSFNQPGKQVGVTGNPAELPPQPQAPGAPAPTSAKVSIDDDPVLGEKNAQVTLIEFSDYECPFCKRHFDETYPNLKKDYIDTGKVKLVYRDYPLPFHDPMATVEAIAANCARDQGGDIAYFKFHDEIFKRTTSNGNGLSKDKVYAIASDLSLNGDDLKSCVEAEKYKDEVQKDIADGAAAGASGTPTFFIGKSDSTGTIEGNILVGAQPYTAFQSAIDNLLK